MLGMSCTMEIYGNLECECSLCETNKIGGEDHPCESVPAQQVMSVLCGAVKYAICPNCLKPVPKQYWTKAYKIRWTRRVKKIQANSRAKVLT